MISLNSFDFSPFFFLPFLSLALWVSPSAIAQESGPAPQPRPPKHTNRLINETSPYLLQHAHNPVNWYSWGKEAFEAARAQDKPIFLSVGYSTCYWCHVMERESFENEETAAYMNEHFICIKVDREERPDVDDIYMGALHAMGERGGWPMSSFLEPKSLKPFYGGTYFPDQPKFGRPSFIQLLQSIDTFWKNNRPDALQRANEVAQRVVQNLAQITQPVPIGQTEIDRAVSGLMSSYDATHGGFGRGPTKFPLSSNLELLIALGSDDPQVRAALLFTLDKMATGGIYDQIGGGFHRYSTDPKWLVPHFEKMLYDNGQIVSVYGWAYEQTHDPFYAKIVRESLDYILREMVDQKSGGFYSAQDAEVNHREGQNYIWTTDQITTALQKAGAPDLAAFALNIYGFNEGTNFIDPHHPEDGRKNVIRLNAKPAALAIQMNLSPDEFNTKLHRLNATLLSIRNKRDQPGTDDKILTAWNALMIVGMVDGARILDDPQYLAAAERAAGFILDAVTDANGHLLRTYGKGKAKIPGFLEDYALMIRALLALHRSTEKPLWLDHAKRLTGISHQLFWDDSQGGYFNTQAGQEDLFVRTKSTYDGVVPTGITIMIHNLLDLYETTKQGDYLDQAATTLRAVSGDIKRNPASPAYATTALKRFLDSYPDKLNSPSSVSPVGIKPLPTNPISPRQVSGENAVAINTSIDTLSLSPGDSTTFDLTLNIADGYHINAHQPGQEFLIGLDIRIIGGKGLALHIDYPPGEKYRGESTGQEEINIHTGHLTLPVTLECAKKITGSPKIMAIYQVCTDRVCLPSTGKVLPLKIMTDQ